MPSKHPSTDKIIVLSNCGSLREARRIAAALVEQRLAACVNIVSVPVESVYRWKGKVEHAKEFLLIAKTSRARFTAVARAIRALHSYDVPEIIALPLVAGSQDYLSWLAENLGLQKMRHVAKKRPEPTRAQLAATRLRVRNGIAQIEDGNFHEYHGHAGLRALARTIKARACKRL